MAYSCDDTYEDALVSSGTFITLSFLTTEGALILSTLSEVWATVVYETAPVTGVGNWIAPGDLYEVAAIFGDALAIGISSDLADEAAVLGSSVYPMVGGDVYETAALGSTASSSAFSLVVDAAILNDVVTQGRRFSLDTFEVAALAGFSILGDTNLVYETALVGSSLSAASTFVDTVLEDAVLNDLVTDWLSYASLIDEAAVLGSSMTQSLTGSTTVLEQAFLQGYAIYAAANSNALGNTAFQTAAYLSGRAAWVAFAPNVAMSRYEGLQSRELVMIDGTAFGVSELGIFELTSDGDVPSEVLTGILDFDDPKRGIDGWKRKHVDWVYATGESVAAYNMRVMTIDNDVPVTRVYAFPFPNGPFPRNTRCQLGKLTWARYWQFAFTNNEPHTLRGAQAQLEVTARRV